MMRLLRFSLPAFCAVALVLGLSTGCGWGVASISDQELLARMNASDPPLVLDVRSPKEYAAGHISGAVNLPYNQVEERVGELGPSRNRQVVVYCEHGPRAYLALGALEDAGFRDLRHLDGDMSGWRKKQLPCTGC
jgi:phage shock protein E